MFLVSESDLVSGARVLLSEAGVLVSEAVVYRNGLAYLLVCPPFMSGKPTY